MTASSENTQTNTESPQLPKKLLARAVLRALKPLARLAIRAGMTHSEFSDLTKMAFVDAARGDYGIRGRPANKSRIAILTGLGRKQVKQYLDKLSAKEIINTTNLSPASRVISAWHQDSDFLDEARKPISLRIEGPHPSFSTIVRKYAGDIPEIALLNELLRANTIAKDGEDKIKVVSRVFLTTSYDPNHLRVIGTQLSDLGNTAIHNLEPPKGSKKWLQRYVFNDNMSPKAAEAFQQLAKEKTQTLLEEFDAWLIENEQPENKKNPNTNLRTGVGIYYFENKTSEQDMSHG